MGFAVRLIWKAARWRAVAIGVIQALAGLGVSLQLLLIERLLSQVLSPRQVSASTSILMEHAGPLLVVVASLGFMNSYAANQLPLLREQLATHVDAITMRTAASVDLMAFESPAFFDRLQRVAMQNQVQPLLLTQHLLLLTSGVFGALGVGLTLLKLEPVLLAAAAAATVPSWISARANAGGQYSLMIGTTEGQRLRVHLRDLVTSRRAAKEIRAYDASPYFLKRHGEISRDIVRRTREEAKRAFRRQARSQLIRGTALGLLAFFILWRHQQGHISTGAALTVAVAALQFLARLSLLCASVAGVFEARLYLADFAAFVDEGAPAMHVPGESVDALEALEFQDVHFQYPGSSSHALSNITCRIERGSTIAIVGENGSGKTTFAKLLSGLYAPTAGRVCWNGHSMQSLDVGGLRNELTVVFQDFVQYPLTIRENVGLGRWNSNQDDHSIEEPLRLMDLHDVVANLPYGLDTPASKEFANGHDFSLGQWQRIVLARALFRDSSVLVLDEPTAMLDARAEARLFEHLTRIAEGRTTVLITHRFGTVRMADRIFVLDKGRLVESGTHTELLNARGQYAELYELQRSQFDSPRSGF